LLASFPTAEYYSSFLGIEKGTVLQEARVFHDPQLDARRCCQVPVCPIAFQFPSHGISRYDVNAVWFGF
jgi:hypothetical protein